MTAEQFQIMFAYHFATTDRLLAKAAELPEHDYNPPTEQRADSIHAIFLHLLTADYRWRKGFETLERGAKLDPAMFTTVEALRAGFTHEASAWQALLGKPENLAGEAFGFARWHILQHLMLHGMQHHSEIAKLLTDKGYSPGDIDFIFFKPQIDRIVHKSDNT